MSETLSKPSLVADTDLSKSGLSAQAKEAEEARDRRERLLRIRKAKLEALAGSLTSLAEDYSAAHPGKTLAIVDNGLEANIEVINDTTYNKLDRIAASAILGEIDA